MGTVLLVPGFTEKLRSSRDYPAVLQVIEEKGYKVEFFQTTWRPDTTISDWVAELCTALAEYDMSKTILSGFSMGANIALSAAAKVPPQALWCFSLPAHYAEDMPNKAIRSITNDQQYAAFEQLEFPGTQISCPTLLFVGSEEHRKIHARAQRAHVYIPGSKVIEVPGAIHDVTHPAYLEGIRQHI